MSAIRRHVYITAPPRRIWGAWTTADGLQSWLADEARIEPRKGGRVTLVFEGDDGEPVELRGTILKWRPTAQLEVSWDRTGGWTGRGSNLSVQIARDGDETKVSIVHSGGEAVADDEQRSALDKDWKRDLRALQSLHDAS